MSRRSCARYASTTVRRLRFGQCATVRSSRAIGTARSMARSCRYSRSKGLLVWITGTPCHSKFCRQYVRTAPALGFEGANHLAVRRSSKWTGLYQPDRSVPRLAAPPPCVALLLVTNVGAARGLDTPSMPRRAYLEPVHQISELCDVRAM